MQGQAIAPPHQVTQIRWFAAAVLFGIAGSMIAIAAAGSARYRIGPIVVEMKMRPSTSGVTELAVEPVRGLKPGFAEADTHLGFLAFRATVDGVVGQTALPDALLATTSPSGLAEFIKEEGGTAMKKFALRIGLLTIGGGAAGGLAMALVGMRSRRIFQGAIAGLIVVGVLGLVAWQTYDIEEFKKVQFKTAGSIIGG